MITRSQRNGVSFRTYLWRRKIMLETTFGISVMEPWEKLVFFTLLSFLTVLFFTGLYRFLPQSLVQFQRRLSYYLWGHQTDERAIRHWMDTSGLKEL
ncbi:hypothetical protein BJ138DRAFT_997567 [Hygrophoropsis aurantiaca]|uniref:Uncharacterized protein n=1 Tax=Hygrophoropsis aurantiaca TaxID=72124 RepID=A0ACB8ARS2_9AGAM|nr:hypothetical protein BJ138DRAFT_997567 [Hygrophoropsis aurantiaca]